MKRITREYIQTSDGSEFLDEDQAVLHEAKTHPENLVAGRTVEQIADAVSGTDIPLRDAIEELGKRATANRLASGDRKRKASEKAAEPEIVQQAAE